MDRGASDELTVTTVGFGDGCDGFCNTGGFGTVDF